MKRRLRAAGLHLLVSLGIAAVAAALVFGIWYPPPYAAIAGGLSLFVLLVSVDVVLGPALTAVVASANKPTKELRRDIALIALVQAAAFAYGMHAIAVARPVYMVFEVDRLTIVSAVDIDPADLTQAGPGFGSLPWTGPRLIAARRAADSAEMLRSLDLSFSGKDISMQPQRWVEYDAMKADILKASKPVSLLVEKHPELAEEVRGCEARAAAGDLRFLPLTSRRVIWTALMTGADARVVCYLPVDGFL